MSPELYAQGESPANANRGLERRSRSDLRYLIVATLRARVSGFTRLPSFAADSFARCSGVSVRPRCCVDFRARTSGRHWAARFASTLAARSSAGCCAQACLIAAPWRAHCSGVRLMPRIAAALFSMVSGLSTTSFRAAESAARCDALNCIPILAAEIFALVSGDVEAPEAPPSAMLYPAGAREPQVWMRCTSAAFNSFWLANSIMGSNTKFSTP